MLSPSIVTTPAALGLLETGCGWVRDGAEGDGVGSARRPGVGTGDRNRHHRLRSWRTTFYHVVKPQLRFGAQMNDEASTPGDKNMSASQENANRLGEESNGKREVHPHIIPGTVRTELKQRTSDSTGQKKGRTAKGAKRVRDNRLLDRVLLAVAELPTDEWEVEILKEVEANPK
jgi:hypothetical protein